LAPHRQHQNLWVDFLCRELLLFMEMHAVFSSGLGLSQGLLRLQNEACGSCAFVAGDHPRLTVILPSVMLSMALHSLSAAVLASSLSDIVNITA